MKERSESNTANQGSVLSVRGSVIDAYFPKRLPSLNNVLRGGKDKSIVIEILTHLDSKTVRGIALTSTQGLAQGASVLDVGHPLKVPVGKRLLGRMFNVFGETIDEKEAIKGGEWRVIHQDPIPLDRQSTTSEIFTSGIKAIDVLAPLERGGKAGLFGGCRCRENGSHYGIDPECRGSA